MKAMIPLVTLWRIAVISIALGTGNAGPVKRR